MAAADPNRFDRLRAVRRAVGPIEAWEVERFGRSGLSVLFRTPVLVLHTVGRRSGAPRRSVLAVHEGPDGTLLVVGGAGGQARTPDWVLNLRADPDVEVTWRRRRVAVRAVELAGAERDEAWERLGAVWPRITTYERRAGHPVPVLRLTSR